MQGGTGTAPRPPISPTQGITDKHDKQTTAREISCIVCVKGTQMPPKQGNGVPDY